MKVLIWIVMAVVAFGVLGQFMKSPNAYPSSSQAAPVVAAPTTIVPDLPSQHLTLAKSSWRKGGFDSVAFGTFSVKNDNTVPVKDIEIACDFFGKSGTRINSGSATIFDTAPPKKDKSLS
jgi:hypothetical protein